MKISVKSGNTRFLNPKATVPMEVLSDLLCDVRAVNQQMLVEIKKSNKHQKDILQALKEGIDKADEGIVASQDTISAIEEVRDALNELAEVLRRESEL